MPWFPRRHLSTAILLALCALSSLAVAPSQVSVGASSGECLHGYAYVVVVGMPVGLTSDTCYHPTDCTSFTGTGPTDEFHGPVSYHYHVHVPVPHNTDVTCYL